MKVKAIVSTIAMMVLSRTGAERACSPSCLRASSLARTPSGE